MQENETEPNILTTKRERYVTKNKDWIKGGCISRPPALSLTPGPGPSFVFSSPGLQFIITGPSPRFVFTDPGPQFVFTGPCTQFVFTNPGLQFIFTGPTPQIYYQSGAWVCIYQPCLFNLYLYLRPWPRICITGPEPEYAFTLLVVVVTVEVVISLV